MKRAVLFLALLLVLVSVASTAASAPLDGGYDLSWWTVDGGGGTLSDAVSGYTLNGTAGQPDAATWQGQGCLLLGGFWGGALPANLVFLPLVLRNY
jgi:hypothetical protein